MNKLLYILLFVPLALFGQENYSLSFDGVDDYVNLGNSEVFDLTNSFTIQIDVYPEIVNPETWHQAILSKKYKDGWGAGYELVWADANNFSNSFGFNTLNGNTSGDYISTNLNINQWYNLVLTFDGEVFNLYVDSELVLQVNYSGSLEINDINLILGRRAEWGAADHWFKGKMDNLIIYDFVLSPEDIHLNMNCNPTGNEEGLIGFWNFNEGNGNTSFDLSVNQNNGILNGVTWSENVPSTLNNCVFLGCTDQYAFNYDDNANSDDGSCIDIVNGCLDNDYIEFNQLANTDDGSCEILLSEALDSLSNELEELTAEATTSLSSLQQALDTWNTTIDLNEGWNMFGYGCPSPIDVADGLSNHTESIIITKDNNGNVYMPEFGFNGIGDFTPGFGYQVKLSEAIEDFSLCDWYVNDIPEDNIVSLHEEIENLQEENSNLLDSLSIVNSQFGCTDSLACNFNISASYDDGSCYNNDFGCGCDGPIPNFGFDCLGNPLELYIGMQAYGGVVFYIDESGEHGLVAAMQDIGPFPFGCFDVGFSGANGEAIGTGFQNTLDILSGCSERPIAASEAMNYQSGAYTDWYLPSLLELLEIYNTIGNGGSINMYNNFENAAYLSSTVATWPIYATFIEFSDGAYWWTTYRDSPQLVRPIRSF